MNHDTFQMGVALAQLGGLLLAARVLGDLCERVSVPAVIGNIVAGIALGPSLLGALDPHNNMSTAHSLQLVGELGAIALLFEVGLETDLGEIRKVGASAVRVAVIGVVLPVAAGAAAAMGFGVPSGAAVMVGGALAATSVGITAKVFGELRALSSVEARVVLGAAVTDDVLGLLVLTAAVPIATGAGLDLGHLATTLGWAIGFLAVAALLATVVLPRIVDALRWDGIGRDAPVVIALAVTLLWSAAAEGVGLAPIIGAVFIGLAFGRSRQAHQIGTAVAPISAVLVPLFFGSIGVDTDLSSLSSVRTLSIAAVLSAVAIAGKLVAGAAAREPRIDRLAVGIGMVPRGEVGLIFAAVGRATGALSDDMAGAVLVAVLVTTLIAPVALRRRMARHTLGDVEATAATPFEVAAVLAAAERTLLPGGDGATSTEDLVGLVPRDSVPRRWDPGDTPALVRLLRAGSPTAWSIVQSCRVFELTLPEVVPFIEAKQAQFSVDPLSHLRFDAVDRLIAANPSATDTELLAAFALQVSDTAEATRALIVRLERDVNGPVSRLAIAAEALRHRADAPGAIEPRHVRQLADTFTSAAMARSAGTVAAASDHIQPWYRDAVAELVSATTTELSQTTENDSVAAAARARVSAAFGQSPASARLAALSDAALLTLDPDILESALRTVDPPPARGRARVVVAPLAGDDAHVVIAVRRVNAIVSRVTHAVADCAISVRDASVLTWADGAVLVVLTATLPPGVPAPRVVETVDDALGAVLRRQRPPRPRRIDADVTNVDTLHHTLVRLNATDRSGLLADMCAALETGPITIASAAVHTMETEGNAPAAVVNTFELVHSSGRRLNDREIERISRRLGASERSD